MYCVAQNGSYRNPHICRRCGADWRFECFPDACPECGDHVAQQDLSVIRSIEQDEKGAAK